MPDMDEGLKRDLMGWVLSARAMPDGEQELRSRLGGALEAASSSAADAEDKACATLVEGREDLGEGRLSLAQSIRARIRSPQTNS